MNGGRDVYLMDDPPGNGGQPVAALSPLLETGEGRRGWGQHHRQEHPGHSQHVRHGHAQLSPICQPGPRTVTGTEVGGLQELRET